jgi:hypothetical protein
VSIASVRLSDVVGIFRVREVQDWMTWRVKCRGDMMQEWIVKELIIKGKVKINSSHIGGESEKSKNIRGSSHKCDSDTMVMGAAE